MRGSNSFLLGFASNRLDLSFTSIEGAHEAELRLNTFDAMLGVQVLDHCDLVTSR